MDDKKKHVLDQALDLYKIGKVEEARVQLRQVISQMPSGWRPIREDAKSIRVAFWNVDEFQLYVAYHKKNEAGGARNIFYDFPSYSEACYLLAFIDLEQQNTVEALNWLDKGLSLEPDHPTLLAEKALALQTMGRHAEAVELYLRATTVRPWATVAQRALALRGAAVSSIDLGQFDEAEQLLRQSLVLEPTSQVALRELDYIAYLRRGGRQLKSKASVSPPSYSGEEDSRTAMQTPYTPYKRGNVIGGKYEVHDVLGKGGFGVVYKVFDRRDTSIFALKTFRDEYLRDEQTRKRFRKEASLWMDLERHPYLVHAQFVEEIEGRLYIGMEYVAPGEQGLNSLDGYLGQRPPDLAQSLRWGIQFCHGMEYACSRGIRCHRDIKPANIMISHDKTVKIVDFGLAGVLGTSGAGPGIRLNIQGGTVGLSGQTMEGTGFGTPTHMPPEQFTDASSCDERSDIYSFGVVLYQMASGGRIPFLAPKPIDDSEAEKARFWREMHRLHSQAQVPRLDSPLFPTIQRCMEKNPAERFQSFCELRGRLESLLKVWCGEVTAPPVLKALDAQEWNSKGVSFANLGSPDEALLCYDKAIELDPRLALAWNNKGVTLRALDRHEEAMRCYDKALDADPALAVAWRNKGAGLENQGLHEEAIRCYDEALGLDPLVTTAWNGKRRSLLSLGRYDEAICCRDKRLESVHKVAEDLGLEGIRLYAKGQLEQAVRCLNKALEMNPRAVGAWSFLGLCLSQLGRYEEAIRCYGKLLETNPRTNEPGVEEPNQLLDSSQSREYELSNRGRCLYHLGRYGEAIRDFDEALRLNPRHAASWSFNGLCLSLLGRPDDAARCHNKALELEPQFALAWFNRGLSLAQLGRNEVAIRCYDEASKLDPQDAQAWRSKAEAQEALGRGQDAVRSYTQFIALASPEDEEQVTCAQQRIRELKGKGQALNPPESEALEAWEWNMRGVSLGRDEEAIRCYNKALELDPRDAVTWHNKGIALKNLGQYEEAVRCCDEALALDPRDSVASYIRGCSLDSLGRYEETICCFDRALELDPRYAEAWYGKGCSLTSLGRYEEAICCYDRTLKIDPRHAAAWGDKGSSLVRLGRCEDAVRCLDMALEVDPRYAEAWYNSALAQEKLGRQHDAVRSYKQFIALGTAQYAKQVEYAKQRIHELEGKDGALVPPEMKSSKTKELHSKGFSLDREGRYDEAIRCYDKLLELDPRYAVAWYNKGNSLDALGRDEEAIRCYDKALEVDPRIALAWYGKGIAQSKLGRSQDAVRSYKQFIALNPPQWPKQVECARQRVRELEED